MSTRQDRLYILAEVCRQRNITPNSNTYMGMILGVCAANFGLPKTKARELAQILTTAYKQDKWQNILGAITPTTPEAPAEFTVYEAPKNTPKRDAQLLKGMAKRDTYDGVGRLILKEIQLELGNITSAEVVETWQTYNHKDTIEQTNNNIFLIYWGGKETVKETRSYQPIIWNPKRPVLEATKEYYKEPMYEKDSEPAADKLRVGEVSEDNTGVVNEDE
jgi:hypothetical protein